MRKLKLEIADLEVTSFTVVAREGGERGTVAGRYHDQAGTQHNGDTCHLTCPYGCSDHCGSTECYFD